MSHRYRQSVTVTSAPTLQLLEWIRESERTYADTVDVWHSHCPRLTIWEDAIADGLVEVREGCVGLTPRGLELIQ
jgi:hypothetical protein